MNPVKILKAPVEDISKLKEIFDDMKKDKVAFKANEINSAILEKRKKANLIKFSTVGAPLAFTAMTITIFGSAELYHAYKMGIPFNEYFGSGLEVLNQIVANNYSSENMNFLDALSSGSVTEIKNYLSYVVDGTMGFLKDTGMHLLNQTLLITSAAAYGVTNAGMKAMGFFIGEADMLTKYRMNDQEELKLKILRNHFHDPIFDNLNNEEIFAMSLTFNEVIRKNQNNKKKILKPVIKAIDKFTFLLRPLRMAFNKSTNDKDSLMSNVFDYLESDIVEDNLSNSLKKYKITNTEFNSIASRDGVLTENEKQNYLSTLNKRAMVSSYKQKTQDDMMLAFALRLEEYSLGEVELKDPKFQEDLRGFENFIKLYSKENRMLEREKLPEELRIVGKITKMLKRGKEEQLNQIKTFKENYNYIDFLKKHCPHLVEKKEEGKYILNNYSFISYYEAERERFARRDVVKQRLYENTKSLYRHSKTKNVFDYKKKEETIEDLTKELAKLDSVFFDNESLIAREFDYEVEDILKPELSKISSIYNDHKIDYQVIVRNVYTEKEKEFLLGKKALQEKGMTLENAKRAKNLRLDIDKPTKSFNEEISRKSFKIREKKYR